MNLFLSGAVTLAYLVSSLFFLKFYWKSRDMLFAWFALAFLVFAGQRVALSFFGRDDEDNTLFYSVRLVAFLLILVGIIQKNMRSR